MPNEQMRDDDLDGFHDLMARSFEKAEFLYWKAKQGCDSEMVVLVASSDDGVLTEASDEFHEDSSYRVFWRWPSFVAGSPITA